MHRSYLKSRGVHFKSDAQLVQLWNVWQVLQHAEAFLQQRLDVVVVRQRDQFHDEFN